MDEVNLEPGPPPRIVMVLWLSPGRVTQHGG
jgi:hypothetical protein